MTKKHITLIKRNNYKKKNSKKEVVVYRPNHLIETVEPKIESNIIKKANKSIKKMLSFHSKLLTVKNYLLNLKGQFQ